MLIDVINKNIGLIGTNCFTKKPIENLNELNSYGTCFENTNFKMICKENKCTTEDLICLKNHIEKTLLKDTNVNSFLESINYYIKMLKIIPNFFEIC